jgi:Fe-S cluster biogenesis protein NfuA
MDTDIKIKALPLDELRCRFTVDRPLVPERAVYFASPEQAAGSPLAETLLAVANVAAVMLSHDTVTVTLRQPAPWPDIARTIGGAIRAQLQSGTPAVSDAALAAMPDEAAIRATVQRLLEDEINPAVASHGGWIALLGVRRNDVFLELGGGCQGCGMANVTLKQGIETILRRELPQLGEILDQTDHAAGRNPYYAPAKK